VDYFPLRNSAQVCRGNFDVRRLGVTVARAVTAKAERYLAIAWRSLPVREAENNPCVQVRAVADSARKGWRSVRGGVA